MEELARYGYECEVLSLGEPQAIRAPSLIDPLRAENQDTTSGEVVVNDSTGNLIGSCRYVQRSEKSVRITMCDSRAESDSQIREFVLLLDAVLSRAKPDVILTHGGG